MERIIRYFRQNVKKIAIIIGIVIFAILLIQTLNNNYQDRANEESKKKEEDISSSITTTDNLKYTVVNNKKIENKEIISIQEVMSQFIDACNNNEITTAYSFLTNECKNAMFKTEEEFKEIYIKNFSSNVKEYSMQAWLVTDNRITYIVRFTEDMLATGKTSDVIEEYYTFMQQNDGNYKININDYIYGESINSSYEQDDIEISVINKDVYTDYEIYRISILNNSEKEICINKYIDSILVNDNKNVDYSMISGNLLGDNIVIKPNEKKILKGKFNKGYNNNVVNKIIIKNITVDEEEYKEINVEF